MNVPLREGDGDTACFKSFLAALDQIEPGCPPVRTGRPYTEQDIDRTVAQLVHLDQRGGVSQHTRLVCGNLAQNSQRRVDVVAVTDARTFVYAPDVLVGYRQIDDGLAPDF